MNLLLGPGRGVAAGVGATIGEDDAGVSALASLCTLRAVEKEMPPAVGVRFGVGLDVWSGRRWVGDWGVGLQILVHGGKLNIDIGTGGGGAEVGLHLGPEPGNLATVQLQCRLPAAGTPHFHKLIGVFYSKELPL